MKKIKKALLLLTAATASMYAYNRYVEEDASKRNQLTDDKGSYYNWKLGRIYYTKEGKGSPVLLIHDIQPSASAYEWRRVVNRLKKTNTVYSLDLLGCGRSDKPNIIYTNYMYVQLITAFVKNIIGENTDVVTSNLSSTFVLLANHIDKTLFNHIILINPVSVRQMQNTADKVSKLKKFIINLPIIGTFIYNVNTRPKVMDYTFRNRFSSDIKRLSPDIIDAYYESAHIGKNRGKYLYSSILGNYMNMNIYRTIKSLRQPVYILYSQKLNKSIPIISEYHRINTRIVTKGINSGTPYPQIESAQRICSTIKSIIS